MTPLIALLVWPAVVVMLVSRLSRQRAILWSLMGAFLLLPVGVGIDPPLLPTLDKVSIPSLVILLMLMARREAPYKPSVKSPVIRLFLVLILVQPVLSALSNGDRVFIDGLAFRGFSLYDAGSILMRAYIMILPFVFGYKYLSKPEHHRSVLWIFVVSGVFYAILAFLELRIGPRLHIIIYGYFQHDWIQMLRDGGIRPILFLPHALWVAFFLMTTVIAALVLWKVKRSFLMLVAALFILVAIVFGKSLGGLMFAAVLGPLVLFTGVKWQVRVAAALALLAMLYPALRGAGVLPVHELADYIKGFNAERAASLQFRLDNEDLLLDHANTRPLLGWGGVGRNLRYHENGENVIVDGYWVIMIGQNGWIGYLARFGLLGWPLLVLYRSLRHHKPDAATAGLAVILAANMIELLPNSTLTPFTWLLAGCVLGYAEKSAASVKSEQPTPTEPVRKRPRTVLSS